MEKYNLIFGVNSITDINLIFADIKLIKCKFDNIAIDISVNNYTGLSKLLLMNYIEKSISSEIAELYKKSTILIKAWCYYEGCILGSNVGLMATYALEVLIIYIFNNFHSEIKSEIDAFNIFFKILNEVNWDKNTVSIFDIFELDKENIETDKKYLLNYSNMLIFIKLFDKFKEQEIFHTKKFINKYMNIIDPIFSSNNLGKSININSFSKIKKIIELTNGDIDCIINERNNNNPFRYLDNIAKLFKRTLSNTLSEIFVFNLSIPKIIVQTESKVISLKDSNINNFSTINDMIIGNFNKYFLIDKELYLAKMLEESLFKKQNNKSYHVGKEILDYVMNEKDERKYVINLEFDKVEYLFNNIQ